MLHAEKEPPGPTGVDVFLSYAREDRTYAERLVAALLAEGFTVWWDRDLYDGQPFANEIDKALRSAKCAIVLWSKHSVDSHWVMSEATLALGNNALVAMRIGPVDLPLLFDALETINLIGWSGKQSDPDYVTLKRAIVAKAGKPAALANSVGRRRNLFSRWFRPLSVV
jgi:adenylate cyclase